MEKEQNGTDFIAVNYNGEEIKVTREVADCLTDIKREAHRERMRDSRHLSNLTCEEYAIEDLMFERPQGFEEELIEQILIEELPDALSVLPESQRRRLISYFYEGLTYREIAAREGVVHTKIANSVQAGLKNLKKYFAD
jgi:RNA polymerase sigma-70 factor (ECF subfamily)